MNYIKYTRQIKHFYYTRNFDFVLYIYVYSIILISVSALAQAGSDWVVRVKWVCGFVVLVEGGGGLYPYRP